VVKHFFVLIVVIGNLLSAEIAYAGIKVSASIKPIHSLVAAVMQGVDTPGLIVDGKNSPHTYTMKPSDAAALEQAQVIFWVGHTLEAFLEKPLDALAGKANIVSLMDAKGVQLLPVREGNGFDAHDDGDEHVDEEHGADGHIWLDPENAKIMVGTIADALSAVDPQNAPSYRANAVKTVAKIDSLSASIASQVAPVKGKGFIVFHDAYHYFENRFGLTAVGAISIHPENPPSAQGIIELKNRVTDGKAFCAFSEPQFDQKLVSVITEGTEAKAGVLDPLGAVEEPGPELYFNVMEALATSLADCLSS
jgi:zinc transport system substrate-binding protein